MNFLLFSLSLHHEAGGIEDLTPCYSLYCIFTYIILDIHISSAETPSWGLFQLLLLSPSSRIPDHGYQAGKESLTVPVVEIAAVIILIAFNLLFLISYSSISARCMDSTWNSAFTYTYL